MFTYSDAANIHRYTAPFLNAAFIATVAAFVHAIRAELPAGAARARRIGDAVLCLALVVLMPVMVGQDVDRLKDHWGKPALPAEWRTRYAAMQNAVPEGAALFVVVSHPYALDYARNWIAGVDVPGAASPDPGLPMFQGPDKFAAYLKAQGFTHLLFRDVDAPGGCLYDRRLWRHNRTAAYAEGRNLAGYYLDLFATLDALGLSSRIVRKDDRLTLIELR